MCERHPLVTSTCKNFKKYKGMEHIFDIKCMRYPLAELIRNLVRVSEMCLHTASVVLVNCLKKRNWKIVR